jgi:DNA-binding GntR family transcriptional regulator
MREQLERAVIRLACEQFPEALLTELADNLARQQDSIRRHDNHAMFALDEEFHRILFAGCRKLGTWDVIQQMNAHLNRTRVLWLTTDPHWENLYEQHQDMYEAIVARDAHRADRLMMEHLQLSISNLPVLQERYPDYFKQS